MKRNCFLAIAASLLVSCLSCSNGKTGRPLTASELTNLNKAVAEYDSLMNQQRYGEIWDAMLPNALKGNREDSSKYRAWIHQQYGSISQSLPLRATAHPGLQDNSELVIESWYETAGEKGRYVDKFIWKVVGNESKLSMHELLQYDEQGHLYMTLTLKNGLGPNDYQTSKVMLGEIERNVTQ